MGMTTPASVSSQEFLWLLTLLRTQTKQQEVGFCKILMPVDWERIIELACKLQVGALLYHRVLALAVQATIPLALLQKLQSMHRQVAVQNLRNYAELADIAKALAEIGVPVILLKGAYLARFVYDSIAIRSMSDVDILILQKDLNRVNEQLEKMGYRPLITDLRHAGWEKPGVLKLEVHWTLTAPETYFHINIDEWWSRAVPFELQQIPILAFCPEDLLLHLCVHASYQHLFEISIRFVCDIAQVIERFQSVLDWSAFVRRTNELGLERGIYISLMLAQQWMQAAIPAFVFDALKPYQPEPQLLRRIASLISNPEQLVLSASLSSNISDVASSPSVYLKIKILKDRLFPSPKELALMYQLSYPSWKVYFYYPVRFKYLWLQYAHILWRLWYGEAPLHSMAQFQHGLLQWFQQTGHRELYPPSSQT